jgi:hypothetical protein
MSRDKLSSKNLNSVRNSDKLKNPAAPSSEEFFSLSTGAAEVFIFIVLRALFQFFTSRDVVGLCTSPTLPSSTFSFLFFHNGCKHQTTSTRT